MRCYHPWLTAVAVLTLIASWLGAPVSAVQAADPAFVGILSLAVEEEVAQKLALSEETRAKLQELVQRREDEAEQLVLKIKDMPPETRDKLMAKFVETSEQMGLALLTDEQKEKLEQVRIARAGLVTLAEPKVAQQLRLSDEQKARIQQLLERRKADLTKGGEAERRATRARYEKELHDVLTGPQQYGWRLLAGLADPNAPPPSTAQPQPAEQPKPASPAQPAERIAATSPVPPAEPGKLRFNFQYADWKRVLEWFAQQADLSLQMDAPPPGTFNYSDNRSYTVSEALDLINGVLQFRGYTLVRNRRMLLLINLEDGGIPPALIETVTPEELDERGKYEQLKCVFPLGTMTPEDAEKELRPLLSNPDNMKLMPTSRQVLVQETGGNLRMIRTVLEAAQQAAGGENIKVHNLQYVSGDDVMAIARPLLGMEENAMATPDGTLKVSFEPLGSRVFYSGTADMVARFQQIIEMVDVNPGAAEGTAPVEQLELRTHTVRADPQTVLEVLQTIFAGQEGVRLATDPVTGNVIALARPSQHQTIDEIIRQMERDAVQFDVIQLRRYDPASMVTMLSNLLGTSSEEGKGPTFEADPRSMQLVVRGTAGEIEQVKQIVEKLDPPFGREGTDSRPTARLIPLTGRQLKEVLETAELLWPTTGRKNKIRVVTPSEGPPRLEERGVPPTQRNPAEERRSLTVPRRPASTSRAPRYTPDPARADRSARLERPGVRFQLVSDQRPAAEQSAEPMQLAQAPAAGAASAKQPARQPSATDQKQPPDIVVTVRRSGIVISCEDPDALDEYEDLIRSLMAGEVLPPEPTVFYLKNAKATEAAQLLREILGLSEGGGFGSVVGSVASNLVGGVGGQLIGGLLGGEGEGSGSATLQTTGPVSITPDNRLNALIVQANPTDLDLIDQLLRVIDQESPPQEPDTAGRTYIIPILYTNAADIAEVVRQAFPENIAGASTSGQRQPSPQELLQAIAGARGRGGRGGPRQPATEERKMTVAVDQRSNSLVVTGPEHLYKKVLDLVEQLDREELNTTETVTVVPLSGNVNTQMLKEHLTAIFGQSIQMGGTRGTSGRPATGSTSGQPPSSQADAEAIRRRIEFFRALQQMRGGGGGGSPFGRGGFFRGGEGGPPGGPAPSRGRPSSSRSRGGSRGR